MMSKFHFPMLLAALCGLVFVLNSPVVADIPPDDPSQPYVRPDPNNFDSPNGDTEDDENLKTENGSVTVEKKDKKTKRGCGAGFAEITIFLIVVISVSQLRRISKEPPKDQ